MAGNSIRASARLAARLAARVAAIGAIALPLAAACSSDTVVRTDASARNTASYSARSTVRPEGQRRIYTRAGAGSGKRITVNGFLWRAALDSTAFMPLVSADPFGGAIITDWYSPPESPSERFKMTVLVQGAALRSDGVKVSVFKQIRDPKTGWVAAKVAKNTAFDLENVIIARARDLRERASAR